MIKFHWISNSFNDFLAKHAIWKCSIFYKFCSIKYAYFIFKSQYFFSIFTTYFPLMFSKHFGSWLIFFKHLLYTVELFLFFFLLVTITKLVQFKFLQNIWMHKVDVIKILKNFDNFWVKYRIVSLISLRIVISVKLII